MFSYWSVYCLEIPERFWHLLHGHIPMYYQRMFCPACPFPFPTCTGGPSLNPTSCINTTMVLPPQGPVLCSYHQVLIYLLLSILWIHFVQPFFKPQQVTTEWLKMSQELVGDTKDYKKNTRKGRNTQKKKKHQKSHVLGEVAISFSL